MLCQPSLGRALSALLAVLASACHAAGTARSLQRPPVPRAATVAPTPAPPLRVSVLPAFGPVFRPGLESSPAWIAGAWRAVLAGPGATARAEQMPARVIAAVPAPLPERAERWLFADEDGSVYEAPGFLAAAEPRARVPRALVRSTRSAGRLVVTDADGALWTSDGREEPHALALPGARLAAFMDARRGAAITPGGGLQWTDNAGASWRLVSLPSAAFDLEGRADGVRAWTLHGAYLVAEGRAVLEHGAGGERAFEAPARDEALDALLPARRLTTAGVVLGDGSLVYISGGSALVRRDLASGAQLAAGGDDAARGLCMVTFPWGAGAGALCHARDDSLRYVRVDRASVLDLPAPGRELPGVNLAASGAYAVHLDACESPTRSDAMCVLDDGRWRTVPLAPGRWPVAMAGTSVLIAVAHEDGPTLALVDARSGAESPVRGSQVREGEQYFPALLPDLSVALAGYGVGDGPSLRVARPGEALSARALPAGARHVRWMGEGRGLAVGAVRSALWYTDDYAAHWTALALPPAAARFDGPSAGASIRCCEAGCLVDAHLWVGATTPRGAVTLAAPGPEPAASARHAGDEADERWGLELQCATSPAAGRSGGRGGASTARGVEVWFRDDEGTDPPAALPSAAPGALGVETRLAMHARVRTDAGALLELAAYDPGGIAYALHNDTSATPEDPLRARSPLVHHRLARLDDRARVREERWYTWSGLPPDVGLYDDGGERGLFALHGSPRALELYPLDAPAGTPPRVRALGDPRVVPCARGRARGALLLTAPHGFHRVGPSVDALAEASDPTHAATWASATVEVSPSGEACLRSAVVRADNGVDTVWQAQPDGALRAGPVLRHGRAVYLRCEVREARPGADS